MTKPTEIEKRIWEILDNTGMNPMLQPATCDRILAVVNKLSSQRVFNVDYCDDDSYGVDDIGLCKECGLEIKPKV
jgi:hypothetical protein